MSNIDIPDRVKYASEAVPNPALVILIDRNGLGSLSTQTDALEGSEILDLIVSMICIAAQTAEVMMTNSDEGLEFLGEDYKKGDVTMAVLARAAELIGRDTFQPHEVHVISQKMSREE